jgi:acyl-CoA reductase-like NAD-dependent aldehyde dehydrogenase
VAGLIIAANTPAPNFAWKVFPALICGNAVVLKAAEDTPISAWFMARIAEEAGLPKGVLNVVHGLGVEAGQALVAHPGIRVVSFTGSPRVGRQIAAPCGRMLKKVCLELGGKNPAVIFPDADLDAAVKVLAWRQFNNSGQHCSGPGRYYIHETVYDAFLEKYIAYAKTVVVGDPADGRTTMGPVVSREHQAKVESYIRTGIAEGAKLLLGGEKPEELQKGFFVMPTVLGECRHEMVVAREEIFGPVAVMIRYGDGDDIAALCNASDYGLCAHIWTGDLKTGLRMVERLHVGAVFVNCQMLGNMQPWGTSVKESGIGKEGAIVGMLEFTDLKLVCVDYSL